MAYLRSLSNHTFHVIILRLKEPNLEIYQNKYKEEEMNKYKDGRKMGVKGRKKERAGKSELLMCATFI
jgi:hypothetical protein